MSHAPAQTRCLSHFHPHKLQTSQILSSHLECSLSESPWAVEHLLPTPPREQSSGSPPELSLHPCKGAQSLLPAWVQGSQPGGSEPGRGDPAAVGLPQAPAPRGRVAGQEERAKVIPWLGRKGTKLDGKGDISLKILWFAQLGPAVCFPCSRLRIHTHITRLKGATSAGASCLWLVCSLYRISACETLKTNLQESLLNMQITVMPAFSRGAPPKLLSLVLMLPSQRCLQAAGSSGGSEQSTG